MPTTDIRHIEDIQNLVNTFYDKVRQDEMLSPIFKGVIKDRWPEHLEKMYRFWQSILLGEHTYFGRPFPPHAPLPINHRHFQRRLLLFQETVDGLYVGEKAEEAKLRASKMAEMFAYKVAYFQENQGNAIQ